MKYFAMIFILFFAFPAMSGNYANAYEDGYNNNSYTPPTTSDEAYRFQYEKGQVDSQEDEQKEYDTSFSVGSDDESK